MTNNNREARQKIIRLHHIWFGMERCVKFSPIRWKLAMCQIAAANERMSKNKYDELMREIVF